MKFLRYKYGNTEYRGILDGDEIRRINGTIFHDYTITDDRYKYSDVTILQPILPSKIIGYRKNYNGNKIDVSPQIFLKPPTSVIPTSADIIYPTKLTNVMIEAEIAVVISRRCFNISPENAHDYILGYMAVNDVTGIPKIASDATTEGKSYDTFTPFGTFIDSTYEPKNKKISSKINGNLVQDGNYNNIIYDTYELIANASQIMTLLPGDVILTGTPTSSSEVKIGDTVEVIIEGLGTIINRVVSR